MIEEKRGVTVTDTGFPEVKPSSVSNGLQSQASAKTSGTVAPALKSSSSWDEDWGPITKGPSKAKDTSSNVALPTPVLGNPPVQTVSSQSQSSLTSAVSSKQTAVSCTPVDIEWPPRSSSGFSPQLGDTEKQLNPSSSTSDFNEIDPFANWPPRPGGISGGSRTSDNGISKGPVTNNYGSSSITAYPGSMNFQSTSIDSWAFNNQSSLNALKPNDKTSASSINSINSQNSQNSFGFLKQNQGVSNLGSYNNKQTSDIGSIFASSKNENTAPKLAPPPLTAVGRGRGRGRAASSTARSGNTKQQSEQPPLLDLL